MIRAVIRIMALLTGLMLGLALAVGLYGQMAHLRLVATLPGWTAAIAGDATPASGRAALPAGFTLLWHFDGVDLQGPRWQGSLERHDSRLPLTARLHWPGGPVAGLAPELTLHFEGGSSSPSGALLTGHFAPVTGTGSLGRDGLRLELAAPGTRLVLDGAGRADGQVRLLLGPEGWQLVLDSPEPWQGHGTDHAALLAAGAD